MKKFALWMTTVVALAAGGVAMTASPAAAARSIGWMSSDTVALICALAHGKFHDWGGGNYDCLLNGVWIMCDSSDCYVIRTQPNRETIYIDTPWGKIIVPPGDEPIEFPEIPRG